MQVAVAKIRTQIGAIIRKIIAGGTLCSSMAAPGFADQPTLSDPRLSQLGQEYSQLEAAWLASGRLRDDRAPTDVAFDAATLARNFSEIALGREYGSSNGGWLLRWSDPIRMHVAFGPSVPTADQATDRAMIAAYARRLSGISGHPITLTRDRFNFLVLVVTDAELRGIPVFLSQHVPELSENSITRISRLPRAHLCMVVTVPHLNRSLGIARAVAIVRAEHPPLMRRSCVEEELAQGMGLPNDDRAARPSIFNDDEEFGVLTRHDEILLRMLYHPDLRPGMGRDDVEARLPDLFQGLR